MYQFFFISYQTNQLIYPQTPSVLFYYFLKVSVYAETISVRSIMFRIFGVLCGNLPTFLLNTPESWYNLGFPNPLIGNQVRHILIILSFLLLLISWSRIRKQYLCGSRYFRNHREINRQWIIF